MADIASAAFAAVVLVHGGFVDGSGWEDVYKSLKKDGYNLNWWRVSEHAGTHMDAPFHFSERAVPADRLALEQLVVPLAVVDIAYKAEQDPDYLLSRDDLAAWEMKNGRLPDNCWVFLWDGRRGCGYLLVRPRSADSGEIHFHVS